jgi:hypothetical protein
VTVGTWRPQDASVSLVAPPTVLDATRIRWFVVTKHAIEHFFGDIFESVIALSFAIAIVVIRAIASPLNKKGHCLVSSAVSVVSAVSIVCRLGLLMSTQSLNHAKKGKK